MKSSSLFLVLQNLRRPLLVLLCAYTLAIVGLLIIPGVDDQGNTYYMSIFDAFYFMTYTASTIGFGELPYSFTYAQRMWVSASVYFGVISWFYAIGSLVNTLSDKLFISELRKARFYRQIENLNGDFIIVIGYNHTTAEVIKNTLKAGVRVVVLEKSQDKINELILESFTPTVPYLLIDKINPVTLDLAGVKKLNCKGVVSITNTDSETLKISLTAKLLNKNIPLVVKSTSFGHKQNLMDIEAEVITDPFEVISQEINMALSSPNLLKLEKWIYGIGDLTSKNIVYPEGKYIVCGFGDLGNKIYDTLRFNKIESKFIEISGTRSKKFEETDKMHIIKGNADDKELLIEAGVQESSVIFALTNDDLTNLSILATAKKINPNITTVARENDIDDVSIFNNANIDHIFMPYQIIINKTSNSLIYPLSDKFLDLMYAQKREVVSNITKRLITEIGEDPKLLQLEINCEKAPEIVHCLKKNNKVCLNLFKQSLYSKNHTNNVICLLLQRDNEFILLPEDKSEIFENDKLLFAVDDNALRDIDYIAQNSFEFHFAYYGEEKDRFKFLKRKKQ